MAIRSFLVLVLLSGLALAQAAEKPPQAPATLQTEQRPSNTPAQRPLPPNMPRPGASAGAELPASTPVVTIVGICENQASKPAATRSAAATHRPATTASSECKTVITKGQLDEIVQILRPGAPPAAAQQLAVAVAQTMLMSHEAEKSGELQKPGVKQALEFVRHSVLSEWYARDLQKDVGSTIDAAKVQEYYDQHKDQFEEAKLSRLYVPKSGTTTDNKPLDEKAAKAEADKMHAELVAGGDLKKLEDQVYSDLGLKPPAPNTDMGMVRKQNLPPELAKVYALKPGEVSDVDELPGGYFIFKMESKSTLPLESARQEIQRTLQNQAMKQRLESFAKAVQVTFNPEFFPPGQVPKELFPAPPAGAGERGQQ